MVFDIFGVRWRIPRLGRQLHTRAHGARIRRNFVFGAGYRFSSAHNITKRRAAEVACRSGGKRNVVHGANAPRLDWLAARLGRDPKRNSKKRFFARASLDIDVECPSGPRPHLRRHLGRGATIISQRGRRHMDVAGCRRNNHLKRQLVGRKIFHGLEWCVARSQSPTTKASSTAT